MTIGLTYTGDQQKHQNYINWLKGNEHIRVIELSAEKNNAAALGDCDGLVLSGGIDINPAMTGGEKTYPNQPSQGWNTDRDVFEKNLYQTALKNQLPLLGICRGLQLVNVLQGGTLINDLGQLNSTHKNDGRDKEHITTIRQNTLLREIVKVENGEVNSAHHQSVQTLGKDLMTSSLAPDGTIEGIEWEDKTGKAFMLCVQWHPERMFSFPHSPLSENIRDRFIEEIRKSIALKK